MARFRNRETGEEVAATRLKSPLQVETRNRGWMVAGAGTWHVVATIPGMRPLVVEDPDFRTGYEALDPSAEKALAQPNPADLHLQAAQHDPPAPPAHEARQALRAPKTARQVARDTVGGDAPPAPVDSITGQPLSDTPAIDPTTGRPAGEQPVADVAIEEEDLTIPTPAPKPPKKKKAKKGKKK